MDTATVIERATKHLQEFPGRIFDVLSVAKPVSPEAAVDLAKVISKLSPLVGNMIEINTCEYLNEQEEFHSIGKWKRQDPGFPDVILEGSISPTPGFEIKAWFPLATEITARFKDSQNHFVNDNTYVAMIAWLPEFLIYGRPKIMGAVICSGSSIAKARDEHYHNPPDYLVVEPENTTTRTRNLQQTNTNGYKWQANQNPNKESELRKKALEIVEGWGEGMKAYSPTPEYQALLRELRSIANYRLDTNYAKIDRVGHDQIEEFATKIYQKEFHGKTIGQWNRLLSRGTEEEIKLALSQTFNIVDKDAEELLK